MTEIQEGTYRGKVKDYGGKGTKQGNDSVMILFEFEANGEMTTLTWQGHLTDKAKEITFKALAVCGFDFTEMAKNWIALGSGVSSGVLDTDREVSLVIANEPGTDGKIYPSIKWVNHIGGGKFRELIPANEWAQKFQGSSIIADGLAFAQGQPPVAAAPKPNLEDVPF